MSNPIDAGSGWRLLGEIVKLGGFQDDHWISDGLESALGRIQVPAPDLERARNAAVAAVARARQSKPTAMHEPLTVRVLASTATGSGTTVRGWGFFVVERAISESNATGATGQLADDKPRGLYVDLYLYADAGSR